MAKRGTSRGFLKAVNKWTKETEQRSEEAFRDGALDFYIKMQEATPVDTGNLRNSLVAQVGGDISTVTGPGVNSNDSTYRSGAEASINNIINLKLGDRINYSYLATYARRLNSGFVGFDSLGRYYNQPGIFWIERVGAQWRSILRAAATRNRLRMK